jgi:5'-nucleotidase
MSASSRRSRRAAVVVLTAMALLLSLLPPSLAADPGPIPLTLFATNDFHGRLANETFDNGAQTRGAAYLSTMIKERRAALTHTSLWVDAGDLVGATPALSNVFYDEPTVRAANLMGLDIQTVGNHEFDRGRAEILRRRDGGCHPELGCFDPASSPYGEFAGQEFVTLSSNVVTESGDTLLPEYHIEEVDGVQVGFVGLVTTDTPGIVAPAGIQGLTFRPEVEAGNEAVAKLRAQGVEAIVVLLHEGGRQEVANPDKDGCANPSGPAFDIAAGLDQAVDVVVTGHTHLAYVCEIGGKLITQADQYGRMFTTIDLELDPVSGDVLAASARNTNVTSLAAAPDPAITALVSYYRALAGPIFDEVVGSSTVEIPHGGSGSIRRGEARLGNLATDALLQQFGEEYQLDFAFQNSGGLRAPLTALPPDADDRRPIRRLDVLEVWPFGNTVWLTEVTGPQLAAIAARGTVNPGAGHFMQVSGLRVDYHRAGLTTGDGTVHRLVHLGHHSVPDGTPVDVSPSARYRVAMNDFMATGGDGYPNLEPQVFFRSDNIEAVIERYLAEESPVSPQMEGRIRELTGMTVTPSTGLLAAGRTLALEAEATYRSGADAWRFDTTEPIADRAVWTSSDETVATVVDGVVTAAAAGTATITATFNGATGSAEVTVRSLATAREELAALRAADGIEAPLAAQTMKAFEQAEKALHADRVSVAVQHLHRAEQHLRQQATVAERNRNRRNDPAGLRRVADAIAGYAAAL